MIRYGRCEQSTWTRTLAGGERAVPAAIRRSLGAFASSAHSAWGSRAPRTPRGIYVSPFTPIRLGRRSSVASAFGVCLGHQAGAEHRDPDGDVREPSVRSLLREGEEKRRDGKQRTSEDVDSEMRGQRQNLHNAHFIVRDQRLEKHHHADRHREDHRRASDVTEPEDPGGRD
jgi:hypothetical protein